MNLDQLKKIEEIFQAAIQLPASQRNTYIAKSCGTNEALRKHVERLIAPAESNIHEFLRTANYDDAKEEAQATAKLPLQIGHYTIVRKVGEGGMGVVYEAKQESPYRTVALKVIRMSLQSKSVLQRFKQEAEIQGRLQHPGIAHIYEASMVALEEWSRDDVQYPFYAMEYIRGQSLTTYAQINNLNTQQRLELMSLVCDAVQYAHEQGIIHRDLKPANILVDAAGQPKILDFGVASIIDNDVQAKTLHTGVGQLMGTLPYMSPEQLIYNSKSIDTCSDVYALGVILFELLAGQLPHDLSNYSIPEAARIVHEEEPPKLKSVNPKYRGDVDTIVSKAMEKDKDRRYQSATELASDIRHYLKLEPIVARPTSTLYQLKKFTIRNKILVFSIMAIILVSIGAAILMGMFALREAQSRRLAELKTIEAQQVSYRASIAAASTSLEQYDCANAQRHLEETPESQRGWEWNHLNSRLDESLYALEMNNSSIKNFSFNSDGNAIIVLSCILDTTNPCDASFRKRKFSIASFGVPELVPITNRVVECASAIHLCKKNRRLRYIDIDHHCYEEDTFTGDNRIDCGLITFTKNLPDGYPIADLPDGSDLIEYKDLQLAILEPGTKIPRKIGDEAKRYSRVYTIDAEGKMIAYTVGGLNHSEIHVRDIISRDQLHVFTGHQESVLALAFSPDGTKLISGSADHTIRNWDLQDNVHSFSHFYERHMDRVTCLAFNSAGDMVASGSQDRTVRLWDAASGTLLAVLVGHAQEIKSVAFSPDGKYLVSVSINGSIRIWDTTRRNDPRVLCGHTLYVYPVALSPDGYRIASGSWDGTIRFWDTATSEWIASIEQPLKARKIISWLAYNPEGTQIAAIETPLQDLTVSRLRIIDVDTGNSKIVIRQNERWTRNEFSPDGTLLAVTGDTSSFVSFINAQTYEEINRVTGQAFCVFSPSGTTLATTNGADVLLYDVSTLELKARLTGHEQFVAYAAFNHEETQLATAGFDHTVRIWDIKTGQLISTLRGHSDRVFSVAYSPDDTRLASGSNDRSIRLWSTTTWEEVAQFSAHRDHVYSLVYSHDGTRLISGSGDFTVRIWETQPLRDRIRSRWQRDKIVERIKPVVDNLLVQLKDPKNAASYIRNLSEFDSRAREIALQIVLSKSTSYSHHTP